MTVDRRAPKQLCQKCSFLGIQSALQLFQLNDDEAVLMCKNVDCTFMSSPQWENLVVARNTSRLNPGVGIRKSSGLRKAHSVSGIAPSLPTTRQTQSLGSNASLSGLQPSSLESSRSSSPFGDPSKSGENQTLVPIAPFVWGQAHTFSSFAARKIEKEQLYTRTLPGSAVSFDKDIFSPRTVSLSSVNRRRPSSVESESVSSGSLDSRPTSPLIAISAASGKKFRKVVVAPETLAKILDGSLQVKFVSSNKSKNKPISRSSSATIAYSASKDIHQNFDNSTQSHQFSVQDTGDQSSLSHIEAINEFVESKGVNSLDIASFKPISQNTADSTNSASVQSPLPFSDDLFKEDSEGCMDFFDSSLFQL